MEERIRLMIYTLQTGDFLDREELHMQYDKLLEEFILNYDERLVHLMKELVTTEKHFWYA